jgi:hypothetical protein
LGDDSGFGSPATGYQRDEKQGQSDHDKRILFHGSLLPYEKSNGD